MSIIHQGFIAPQLCKSVSRPPVGKDWVHETKLDGYRIPIRFCELSEKTPSWTSVLMVMLPKINSNGRRVRCALVCGRLAEFVLAQLSGAHDARRATS